MPNLPRRRIFFAMSAIEVLLLSFCLSTLFAKDKKPATETLPKNQHSYKVPVNVVALNATVTDKAGNPVYDLTSGDFKVYDDGKPQHIQTFALESIHPPEVEETQGSAVLPRQTKAKQKAAGSRMISIVIDDLTMDSVLDFPRIVDAVRKFIEKDIGPMDQVALLSGSRRVQLPFSNNKQELLAALATVAQKLNKETTNRVVFPGPDFFAPPIPIPDLESYYISHGSKKIYTYFNLICAAGNNKCNPMYVMHSSKPKEVIGPDGKPMTIEVPYVWSREEERVNHYALRINGDSEFRTRNLLYTIEQHVRTLRHFEGTKSIVLFSDGFLSERESKDAYQLQKLIDLALRSSIILNTVSTRGIPVYDFEPWVISMLEEDKQVQHSSLAQMADATGGMFFNDNSLLKPLQTIANRQTSYYALTYAMPPHKPNGLYHPIKLEVTRPGLQIVYRKGYYSSKEELTYENTKREDIIDAINAPGNMNEIPMSLGYSYARGNEDVYAVSFATGVNINKLQFPTELDRRVNQISLVLAAYDETDHFISGLEKAIDFQLLESSYSNLRNRGMISKVELKLPPGRYKIKAIVREGTQGKMGSITKAVEIP